MIPAAAATTRDRLKTVIRDVILNATRAPFGGVVSIERLSYLLHGVEPPVPRPLLGRGDLRTFLRDDPEGFWVLDGDDDRCYVGLAPHGMLNDLAAAADAGTAERTAALEQSLTFMLAEQPGLCASLDDIVRWFDGIAFDHLVRFILGRPALFRFLGPPSFSVVLRPTGRLGPAAAPPSSIVPP